MAMDTTIPGQFGKALVPIPVWECILTQDVLPTPLILQLERGCIVPPSEPHLPPRQNYQKLFLKRER